MPLSPITPSLPPANPLANPNTPLPAQNTAAESSEPSHNLPLHLRRFGVTEGRVAYSGGGNRKRILLQKDTTSPIFTLPSTFKPGQYIETRVDKQTSRHPLDLYYIDTSPNDLSLVLEESHTKMPDSSKTTDRMTSSLVGTFKLPFPLRPTNLTHTETTTNTTILWPYYRSSRKTVFVPLELSHEYTINFGTIPDSEKDPTNIKGMNTSMRRSTRDSVTLSLKISIPEKLNKQPDMRFSILFENNVIWECYPHTNRQIGLLAKTSIPNYSVFRISNSGCFDRTYSLDQLIQNQHRSPCTRSHSNIRKIKFHLTMKPDPNGSLTCTTKITIVFSEHLENLKTAPSDKNGVLWRKVFTTKETKFARDPNTQIKLVTRHAHTHTVISYRKGSPSLSPFSALSPAAPQNEPASKYTAPSSDSPVVKKPRISSFDCTQASLPQISLNERPTSGFLPHDPELAEFFASSNDPSDLSLNSPSPPNFDFLPTDDPLKKLLRILDSSDRTRSPSSARLKPIFSSDLFHENSK